MMSLRTVSIPGFSPNHVMLLEPKTRCPEWHVVSCKLTICGDEPQGPREEKAPLQSWWPEICTRVQISRNSVLRDLCFLEEVEISSMLRPFPPAAEPTI